jgi:predicted dehydrogenase
MPPSSNPNRHFIDVVLGRAENESPPEDALKVIAVTEASYKSAELGQAVKVRL